MLLPRAALVGVALALCCLLVTGVVWWSGEQRPERAAAEDPTPTAADVLRGWDAQRARAWAEGDVEALRALYVPGSGAGRRDVAMLRRYVERRLVVEGLTTQLLAVEEVHADEDTWVLEVTDRVHAGTVVGGGVRRALPRDGADRRRLTLRRDGERWRVAGVVALPPGSVGGVASSGGQAG